MLKTEEITKHYTCDHCKSGGTIVVTSNGKLCITCHNQKLCITLGSKKAQIDFDARVK